MIPDFSLVAPRDAVVAKPFPQHPPEMTFKPNFSSSRLEHLPDELKGRVFQYAGDPCVSRVSRAFRSLNRSELLTAWLELESLMKNPQNPLYPHYAKVIAAYPNANWFSRAESLHQKLTEELRILDLLTFHRLTPKNRTFDPNHYIEAAYALKQSNDLSLVAIWEEVRPQLIGLNLSEEQEENLPAEGASAGAIRTWLQNNRHFTEIFEELELNNLDLKVIPPEISYFTNLRQLIFHDNQIQGILPGTFDQLIHLRKVDLSMNEIRQLPGNLFRNNKRIEKVEFQRNNLMDLPEDLFFECFHLKWVDFSENSIQAIPESIFNDCFKLMVVYLKGNIISEVEESLFATNNYLRSLDLSFNQITHFSSRHLARCPHLRNFHLSNNKIRAIEEDWFNGCLELSRISLDYNKIQFVVDDFCTTNRNLITARFAGNPVTKNPESAFIAHKNLRAAYLRTQTGY